MTNDHINELTEFYDNIYTDGICPYYEKCSQECNYELNFFRGRIGAKYGETVPKIFIVGREPVFPKNYNGEKIVFNVQEPCTMKDAGYNDHYLRTFYTVARLVLRKEKYPASFYKNDMMEYEYLRQYFFMTNFYKCVFTNDTNRSNKNSTRAMRANCSEILIKEIEKMKPDIVILQGKDYYDFWDKIEYQGILAPLTANVKYSERLCSYKQGLYRATVNNHQFYIIDSYHPTSHGIWQTKEVLDIFTTLLETALEIQQKTI